MDGLSKTFWSGETLEERLADKIRPFEPSQIDCAAYTLRMGREVYVSPSDQTSDPNSVSIQKLEKDEAFTVPPGQFAFLLTEEIVEVPDDAIAFISIKARIKWRGLVNVSGFHVDPGYKGRLIFTVFNAGPAAVHLRQGQPVFLIWYASLDRKSTRIRRTPVLEHIPADLIAGIPGELQSFAGLSKKIKEIEKALVEKVHSIEREQTYYRVIALFAVAVVVAIAVTWIKDGGLSRLINGSSAVMAPVATSPPPPPPVQTQPK